MTWLSKSAAGVLALLALSGCYYYPDRYYDRGGYGYGGGYGRGYAYGPEYDAWYDGYYGPYYGGYWGTEGDFYFSDADHRYHRDDAHHFRRESFEGARSYHTDRGGYERGRYEHDRDGDRDDDRWR